MSNPNNTIRAILACIQQKTKNNPNHQFTLNSVFADGKTMMNDDIHNTLLDMEREGLIKGQLIEDYFHIEITPKGLAMLNLL